MKQATLDDLNRYVEHRVPTGGFLTAVLENNLLEAVGRAGHDNIRDLVEIVSHVYNNMPSSCWGSPAKVKAWLEGPAS